MCLYNLIFFYGSVYGINKTTVKRFVNIWGFFSLCEFAYVYRNTTNVVLHSTITIATKPASIITFQTVRRSTAFWSILNGQSIVIVNLSFHIFGFNVVLR